MNFYFKKKLIKFLALSLIFVILVFSSNQVFAATSSILSYQGRLTDSSGNLLGGSSGSSYFFKFSFWDNSDVGSGSKVWPATSPESTSLVVKEGVFNVKIGDTNNGYPDVLDYNFNTSQDIYLQVEVSTNNSVFETLGPRQQITPPAYAQIAGTANSVNGIGQSSFGTTTPVENSIVTIQATSSATTALSLIASLGQTADIFNIFNSDNQSIFSINNVGDIFANNFDATSATTTDLFSTFLNSTNLFATNLEVSNFTLSNLNGLLFGTDGDISVISTSTLFSNYYTKNESDGLYDLLGYATSTITTHELDFDHSLIATALQSFTETDPVYTAWDKSTGISVTESQISDLQSYLTSFTETDPVFLAHQASNITLGDITNLSNLSGINTGDQDISGLVPYTGATGNVDLGANNLTVDTDTLFVDSVNHRVGLNTITPDKLLTLYQNADSDGIILYGFDDRSNTSMQMRIEGNGRARFLSSGQMQFSGTTNLFDPTGNTQFDLVTAGSSSIIVRNSSSQTMHTFSENGNIAFNTNQFFLNKSTGELGVGTTSPTEKLEVAGTIRATGTYSSGQLDIGSTGQAGLISFRRGSDGTKQGSLGFGSATSVGGLVMNAQGGAGSISLQSNGTTRLNFGNTGNITITPSADTIFSTGNVGIGTLAPSARLHTISTTEQFRSGYDVSNYWNATTDATGITTFNAVGTNPEMIWSTGNIERMKINSSGNIGIGTTTPSEKLSVIGNGQFTAVTSGTYAYDLNLTSDGILTTSSSDERLKKNIMELDSAGILEKIMQLKPSEFDWKSNDSHDIGLIAQEVEVIFPELVFTNQTDGFKGINYSRLPAILISAVQELNRKITSLFDGTGRANVKELCIEDVCIIKDDLVEILNSRTSTSLQTNINSDPSQEAVPVIIASSTDSILETSTSTEYILVEDIVVENSTTTEEVLVDEVTTDITTETETLSSDPTIEPEPATEIIQEELPVEAPLASDADLII